MRKLLIVSLLAFACQVHAQKDPAAEAYLNKIAQELAPGHAIHMVFDYVRDDLQAKTKVEGSGTLMLLDEKYKLEFDEALIFFDGEKLYSLNTDIEEVYISVPDPDNKEFMFSDPIRLLRSYKEHFKYRLMDSSSANTKIQEEVQLYPEELGGPYALLKLFFSTADKELKSIHIRQKDGIIYTMTITEMEQKATPDPGYFKFSAKEYPNVDVIELID